MKNINVKITKNGIVHKIEEEKIKWLVAFMSEKYSPATVKLAIKNINNKNS